MSPLFGLTIAFLAGIGLSWFYFRGLWWTVQRVAQARSPYRLIIGSFILRSAVVLAGFYFLITLGWQALTTALAGFILARFIVIQQWGVKRKETIHETQHDGI